MDEQDVEVDLEVLAMHQAAEIFEPKTEYVYKYLQVMPACCWWEGAARRSIEGRSVMPAWWEGGGCKGKHRGPVKPTCWVLHDAH